MPRGPATAALAAELDQPLREAIFGLTFRDPVFFHELLFPDVTPGRPKPPLRAWRWSPDNHLRVFWSQVPMLALQNVIVSAGRGLGKTELAIIGDSIRRAICWPSSQIVQTMNTEGLVRQKLLKPTKQVLDDHPILSLFVREFSVGNLTCEFRNDSTIRWEYPGQQKRGEEVAERMQGGRATAQLVDEAQNIGIDQYRESRHQMLVSPADPAMQTAVGAARKIFGVDNGDRTSALYQVNAQPRNAFRGDYSDGVRPYRRNNRWQMPKFAAPYYSREKFEEDLEGCDLARGYYTDKFLRDVCAKHATSSETVFPLSLRQTASREVPGFIHCQVVYADYDRATDWTDDRKWLRTDFSFLAIHLPPPQTGHRYALSFDVGTSQDTVVGIFQQTDTGWLLIAILVMTDWQNPFDQCVVIDWLWGYYQIAFGGFDKSSVALLSSPASTPTPPSAGPTPRSSTASCSPAGASASPSTSIANPGSPPPASPSARSQSSSGAWRPSPRPSSRSGCSSPSWSRPPTSTSSSQRSPAGSSGCHRATPAGSTTPSIRT